MSISVTPLEFETILERALAGIPTRFRRRMENLLITAEADSPGRDLLGLYEGRPLTERSSLDSPTLPDRIRIFKKPHEEMARTRSELEQVVFDTLWHEVGHYFGLSEAEIHRIESRRERLRMLRGRRSL